MQIGRDTAHSRHVHVSIVPDHASLPVDATATQPSWALCFPGSSRLCLEPHLVSLAPGHERTGRYSRATPADASSRRRPATSSISAPRPPERLLVRPPPVRSRLRPTAGVHRRIPTVNYLGARCLRPLALILLAAICVPALPAGAAAASRGPVPPAETARPRIAWSGCGKRLQCAKVRVPLDWDRPGGPKIELSVNLPPRQPTG